MSENPEDQNPEVDEVVDYMDDQQESAAPRVARSVSNQPLISEEQEREHSGGTIPSRPVRRPAPRARRMSLSLTRVDAWSVAKVTFMLSIAAGLIQIVAAGLLWALLNVVGVFNQITQLVSASGLDLANVFSLSTVLSAVTIFSIIEVVIFTVLITIVALLYNVVSSLVGGIHVTLGDD